MQSHQHTVECEFIASGLDPLPDAMRAEWAGAFGQWLAQYRRGVVEPVPMPPMHCATPLAPEPAVTDADEHIGQAKARVEGTEPAEDWPHEGPRLRPAQVAILQVLAAQPEGDHLIEKDLIARTGYSSIRKYLGPVGTLAGYWGLDNKQGYYLDEEDRARVRECFP